MPTVFVILLLALTFLKVSCISGCIESERNALLDFKEGLRDPSNRLSSWSGNDCCNWEGIACSNKSGHVFQLDLRNLHSIVSDFSDERVGDPKWSLGGEIRPSLLILKHLRYLDLSMNNFRGSNIPEFIGSIHNLRYLNLSRSHLGGLIPHHLGNLSRLEYLDLSIHYLLDEGLMSTDGCIWISGLSSIKHLIMTYVRFKNSRNLVQALNMLPSVVEIDLSSCDIDNIAVSLTHVNFTRLSILDLSFNYKINSTLPPWLFNISSLEYLDLSDNSIPGPIPPAIENLNLLNFLMLSNNNLQGGLPKELRNLCKLRILDLSWNRLTGYLPDWLGELRLLKTLNLGGFNSLEGSIPESIWKLTSLQEVDLSYNNLNGTISESLGELVELVQLDVSMNQLEGIISEAHLDNLIKLQYLDVSSNRRLVLNVSLDWVPQFQLYWLRMSSCNIGPKFPAWIRSQANILSLKLSNAGIIDVMPDWFWNLTSEARVVDISENSITGRLSDLVNFANVSEELYVHTLDISSNHFYGALPNVSGFVEVLDLSNNLLSGKIDPAISERMPNLKYLLLSENKLNGDVPPSLCQLKTIEALDLSRNLLSGELPNCWNGFSSDTLMILDFSSNDLSGTIPETFGTLSSLRELNLGNNCLSGVVPSSLKGCTSLVVLDLSQNKLTGKIPTWIGESSPALRILQLRSNSFYGRIPRNLSRLLVLQILDLANNNLWGKIPKSFGTFSKMKLMRTQMEYVSEVKGYEENMVVVMEGRYLTYGDSNRVLSLVTALDLSNNNLSGPIPQELGSLAGLMSLNLSGNSLDGEIPKEIGSMHSLESLDLSRNTLSGEIPSTMGSLTFLADMDLSNNNLSGKIPSGNQFQTFNESSYIGNPGLCGFPLKKACEDDKVLRGGNATVVEDEARSEIWWLYLGMGPGFVAGFWIFCGTLLLKNEWKYALFRFVDRVYDRLYVIVAVTYNRYFRK